VILNFGDLDVTAGAVPVFDGQFWRVKTLGGQIFTVAAPAALTLDLSAADWFAPSPLTSNVVLTVVNASAGQQFTIILHQDAVGSRLITWFGGILWPSGTVPTLTTTAGKRDVFTFKCLAPGQYLGFTAGQNM
jgi:hypothetical protein